MSFIENTEWFKNIKQYSYIMIFGAKRGALEVYNLIKLIQCDIDCFIVSKRGDNPFVLAEKQVRVFREIDEEKKSDGLVIISQKYEKNDKMKNILYHAGFKNIISSALQMTNALTEKLNQYRSSILGEMHTVQELCASGFNYRNNDIKACIYAATSNKNLHKSTQIYNSRYIKYIQAGAKLSEERICELTDDTGNNISELNPYYCELTAGYWIYINDKTNRYVGLYHYSRGLSIKDEEIEMIVESGIDVVLSFPYVTRQELITLLCIKESENTLLEAINRVSPEYMNSAEQYLLGRLFFAGNLIFAKRDVYCRYYEWMFKIFHECDQIRKENGITITPRLHGYDGEFLQGIFFSQHMKEYKVLYAEVKSML